MKNLYTLFVAVLLAASTFAQSPEKMSYQAVVRDSSGALVSGQPVGIQISILQGSVSGTVVYSETHSTSSNVNGLVTLEIGAGATSDDLSSIDWSAGPFFIKTAIDTGAGYDIEGTSQLMSVPYALFSKSVANDAITTTQVLDGTLLNADLDSNAAIEQTKISGLADSLNMKAPLVSPSFTGILSAQKININNGLETAQLIFQDDSVNTTESPVSILAESTTGLDIALSIYGNNESDYYSGGKIVFGDYDVVGNGFGVSLSEPSDEDFLIEADNVFIGSANRQADLTVYGNVTVSDGFTISGDGSGLTNLSSTGGSSPALVNITEGTKTGIRRSDANASYYGDIGSYAVDLSYSSNNSETYGSTGDFSVATGEQTVSSGVNALAGGFETVAAGNQSVAFGEGTIANTLDELVIGRYNESTALNATLWADDEPVFTIGNGDNDTTRSNAFQVTKIGNATLAGTLSASAFEGNGSGLSGLAFSTTNNVTSNIGGTISTDDFVFGSTQLENDNTTVVDDARMFFDKSKGAFRAGEVDADQWNDAGVGSNSVAMGYNAEATGSYGAALGFNSAAVGEASVAMGRFAIANGTGAVAIGADLSSVQGIGPIASNRGSVAVGLGTTSSGEASFSVGLATNSTGTASFAFGEEATASGDNAFSGGFNSIAARPESIALGNNASAQANNSTSIGTNVTANTYAETVFGRYNSKATLNRTSWSSADPLFTIGNGSSTTNTNNAFQILKNGNATLDGTITANAFVGNGAGLTNVTATVSIADESITSTQLLNGTIVDADIASNAAIAQSKISGLATAFDAKQNLILNNGLTIAQTSGLQTALDAKAAAANPTFSGTITLASDAQIQLTGAINPDGKILISDNNGLLILESPATASANANGIVSNSTQSFGGNKTFVNNVNIEGSLNTASVNIDGTIVAKSYEMTYNGEVSGATISLDLSTANMFGIYVTQDITSLTLTNPLVGTYIIKIRRDTVGNRAIAFPTDWRWSGGSTPVITQVGHAIDIITLVYDGTTYYAAISQNF